MSPTEIVQLYIDNDRTTHNRFQTMALNKLEQSSDNDYWTDKEWRLFTLADDLQDHFVASPLKNSHTQNMYSDLLQHALAEVDWHDIAESILTTAQEA